MWLALLLLNCICFIAAPVLVTLALPFARPSDHANCLPTWLAWLNTPDDPGRDQGMYEPQVAWVYVWGSWYLKTLYWLGIRNQCYGLFASLCARYDGSPVVDSTWWRLKIYSCQGFREVTWPGRRVSLGYKVHTLKTAKPGDPIWWVLMPAFWKAREY